MYPFLDGIRVIDLCRLIPGDAATQVLADLGADVIKVEEPPAGDYIRYGLPPLFNEIGFPYLTLNRNKRSISLNLKTPEGRAVFEELVRTADAVVQVSKPGTMTRVGADYATVASIKPDIVYCEMSAYGQTGPWRMFPAHGFNLAATSGNLELDWDSDGYPQLKLDGRRGGGGGIGAAIAVLGALIQRMRTGRGQYIDHSQWDENVSGNTGLRDWLNGVEDMIGVLDLRNAPRYNVYLTADKRVIFLCPIERKFWVSFCSVIGRPDWVGRATFEGQMDWGNYDVTLRGEIQAILETKPADEWLDAFLAADVPAAPVLTSPEQLEESEHLQAREMIVETEHPAYGRVRLLRPPYLLPDRAFTIRYAPPTLGEHTEEVLLELGYDSERMDNLRSAGAI